MASFRFRHADAGTLAADRRIIYRKRMSDAAWNSIAGIVTALGVLVTAIGTLIVLIRQGRQAAKLEQIKTQTDGMTSQLVDLAGKAGQKLGGDIQRERHDVQDAAKLVQTDKLVAATQEAAEAKGWDDRIAHEERSPGAPTATPPTKPSSKPPSKPKR